MNEIDKTPRQIVAELDKYVIGQDSAKRLRQPVEPLTPWLLSFAAGAMLYVVVEELIPEANLRHDHESCGGTCGVMAGFLIMMILDVALG